MDRAELFQRKAKIEALLPLVRSEHTDRLYQALERVNAFLRLPPEADKAPDDPIASESGVNGVGALRFEAEAPPGPGRLVRLPFYLAASQVNPRSFVVTDLGVGAISGVSPVVTVVSDWNAGQVIRTTGLQMRTRVSKFVDLRIVGFRTVARFRLQYGFTSIFIAPPLLPFLDREAPAPSLLCKNLQIGGGTNLFPQDAYVDATIYAESVPEYVGLRDYPVLTDDNTATVSVATTSLSYAIPEALLGGPPDPAPFGAPAAGSPYVFSPFPVPAIELVRPVIQFSMSLVCEVLEDADFGRRTPGPYARRDALARHPNARGTEIVRP